MRLPLSLARRIAWTTVFATAFGLVEAAVVVYLRAVYYPEGFHFPLALIGADHLAVELAREGATMFMLASVALVAGATRWQRIGYFFLMFAVWDLLYYVWLWVFLDWPASIVDWDVLFLIPVPWIGPVVAPVVISGALLAAGLALIIGQDRSSLVRFTGVDYLIAAASTITLLYTFMSDTGATLRGAEPQPYNYVLFTAGMIGYGAIVFRLWRRVSTLVEQVVSTPGEKTS